MENITISLANKTDIPGVLDLQNKYLASNLSEEEKKEGFVTTPFTPSQIEKIIEQDGLFIGKKDNKVIAYAYAGSWDYFNQWPIFPFMTDRFTALNPFNGITISTVNSFQYGPICIEKEFRRTKLLNQVFECMRLELKKRFPVSVTFINKINERSTIAHTKKLQWEIIDEFRFNNNDYLMLAFDMGKSVL